MKKRTFANRIEQLGRIAIIEGEIMRRNHQRGKMARTNTARRILCQYMINVFGRVLDTTNPADKAATTARSYTAAQFQGKQEKSESQNTNHARRFFAVLKDYILGTYLYSVKPRAKRAAKKAARVGKLAALYTFRVIWWGAIIAATFAAFFYSCVLLNECETLRALNDWVRIPAGLAFMAAASLSVECTLIYISRLIDDRTDNRLFHMN